MAAGREELVRARMGRDGVSWGGVANVAVPDAAWTSKTERNVGGRQRTDGSALPVVSFVSVADRRTSTACSGQFRRVRGVGA